MKMRAKFAGTCVRCKGVIRVGNDINWTKENGASHADHCVAWVAPKVVSDGTTVTRVAAETMVPGVYKVDGTVYAVRTRKDKKGLYAMKMVETKNDRAVENGERAKVEFVYEYGVVLGYESKVIKLADRMSIEEGKALTTLYGRCLACQRQLKAAKSVEQGIGPVCITYFGPVFATVEAETVDGREVVVAA